MILNREVFRPTGLAGSVLVHLVVIFGLLAGSIRPRLPSRIGMGRPLAREFKFLASVTLRAAVVVVVTRVIGRPRRLAPRGTRKTRAALPSLRESRGPLASTI